MGRTWRRVVRGVCLAVLAVPAAPSAALAAELPKNFEETTVAGGLVYPTAVTVARNGRLFIAEKSGLVKTYRRARDRTPRIFADLRTEVHNFHDRGLLGLAVHPRFPKKPHVYVLYSRDAPLGGAAPAWGARGVDSDFCPDPPGPDAGCVISGRLVRLTARRGRLKRKKVLVDDWCQQFGVHSVGDLVFGKSGALYASGGEGARPTIEDYGQFGEPPNPCGDPPAGVGGPQAPPSAEGGSLRSQDLRTTRDPVGLGGSVIRIDPRNGRALPDNPNSSSADPNARRIVAYGLRNPFRLAVRPGTDEVWIGDVGDTSYEEIDRLAPGELANYGWPCYEGAFFHRDWDALDVDLCETLYAEEGATGRAVSEPWLAYARRAPTVAGDDCETGQSAISALAFYRKGRFPSSFDGALFFGDYTRECIWVIKPRSGRLPDPDRVRPFLVGDATPVDLEPTPGGLYYADIFNGEVKRIRYVGGNRRPRASIRASRTYGRLPLDVRFNGSKSRDPERKRLRFRWDLDGDGRFDDSRRKRPTRTYRNARRVTVSLRVLDRRGQRDTKRLRIFPGNTPPKLDVRRPGVRTRWRAGGTIRFAGVARDREDGRLAARRLDWELLLRHCHRDGGCHTHPIQEIVGARRGSFVAPEHELPSYLRLRVTATDSDGMAARRTLRLRPRTARVTLLSEPSGLELGLNDEFGPTPVTGKVIVGSRFVLTAPSPQQLDGVTYEWSSWSDGGARVHDTVTDADTTIGATFAPSP